ncbi:pseudouridine synthase [Chitinophaga arvensicola]|uniref:Pseudouridine synthase n=1 Tax=Chitinophaga arvensicola TaxID=29529 RepID=A0A1I0S7A8_9BACT|nr:pseudouridine synthase [Chitinophaga arvensicola]SEW51630.1 ribosomal small subunit pseudouridine synthase A [Chitinophaga arvensicola]
MHRYFVVNKPYDMVSQFVSSHDVRLLGELQFDFPEGTHAIGRLDNHSEGLLILTTNKKVTRLLFQGEQPHERTYLVKVKGEMSADTLQRLKEGVPICIAEGVDYVTVPCNVEIVQRPPGLFDHPRELPVNVPHTWLLITLTEGKFHQVRKMVAAVSHRCQRLIRVSIEGLLLGDLPPGAVKEFEEEEFFRLLKIANYKD